MYEKPIYSVMNFKYLNNLLIYHLYFFNPYGDRTLNFNVYKKRALTIIVYFIYLFIFNFYAF